MLRDTFQPLADFVEQEFPDKHTAYSARTEMARRGSAKFSSSHKYPGASADMTNGTGTKRRSRLLFALE